MKNKRFILSVLFMMVMAVASVSAEKLKVREIKKCKMWQTYTGETYDQTMKVLGDTVIIHWTKDSDIRLDEHETTLKFKCKETDQSKIEKIVRNEKKSKKYCLLVTDNVNDFTINLRENIRYVFEDDLSQIVKGYGKCETTLHVPIALDIVIYYVEADDNFQVWVK